MYHRCRLHLASRPAAVLQLHLLRSTATTTCRIPSSTRYQSTTKKPHHLQSTRIPTFHFQKSLPRLPIPELKNTLARYQAAIEPITTREEFEETVEAVQDFGQEGGVGEKLHAKLIARDESNPETSYINQWWLDMYVENRLPLVINSNPQIRLRDDPCPAKNSQVQRTASLIVSSLRFICTLRDLALKPDIYHMKPQQTENSWVFDTVCRLLPESMSYYGAYLMKAYPLDMSQYGHLFRSTRVPRRGRDELRQGPEDARHVVIQRGKELYQLDVLDSDLNPISAHRITRAIDWILAQPLLSSSSSGIPGDKDDKDKDDVPGVGYFTTLDRDTWADARETLVCSDSVNRASVETIDSALFVVCLEHTSPDTTVDLNRCFLHSDGENRWFDKSFQLIVTANGKAAVNFEHSWGDGVAVLRYLNEVYQDSIEHPVVDFVDVDVSSDVRLLPWTLTRSSIETLVEAREDVTRVIQSLYLTDVEMDFTRDHFQHTLKIGIDGVLQMAIQLAHYRLHQTFVSTYESASTAAFRHGRTETVRSCTREAVAFVQAMSDSSLGSAEKETRLRDAIRVHNDLTKSSVLGQGCDRHVFALRKIWDLTSSSDLSLSRPVLFDLASVAKMNHIILSTSTLSSPYLEGGGFGPVNHNCYGVGYGMEEKTVFQLATYRDDAPALNTCLRQSLEDIHQVLMENRA